MYTDNDRFVRVSRCADHSGGDASTVDGKGSLVEVLLVHPEKDARPDIQAEYELASLGEVECVYGPYCDPPRWMVCYNGKVSAKKGNWINPKDASASQSQA